MKKLINNEYIVNWAKNYNIIKCISVKLGWLTGDILLWKIINVYIYI